MILKFLLLMFEILLRMHKKKADLKLIANQRVFNLKHSFSRIQLIKFHGHKKSAKCQFKKILS